MNKKLSLTGASFTVLLLFAAILVQYVNLATSNPIGLEDEYDPVITIMSDGTVDPTDVPIHRTGNVYTLTNDIQGHSLDIQCSEITVDGAGYAFQAVNVNLGIVIEANGVRVKNLTAIGISVASSFNTIIETNTANGVSLAGGHNNLTRNNIYRTLNVLSNYNTITGNILDENAVIFVYGSYNNITGNFISGSLHFRELASFNTIVGNTINPWKRICYVGLDREPNAFYLNNFVNCTISADVNPDEDLLAVYSLNTFDNGLLGNYWNDYNGTDANRDGIGDTPYLIGGNLTDRFPLMAPYDIENNTIIVPTSTDPFPTTLAVASAATVTVLVAAGLLVYSRKRKRS